MGNARVATLISNNKTIRYCVFSSDEKLISKKNASIQISSAFNSWIKSIKFYDKNNKIYDKENNEINLNEIKIIELNCNIIERDIIAFEDKREIDKSDYISFYFSSKFKKSFYREGVIIFFNKEYLSIGRNAILIGIQINNPIDDMIKKLPRNNTPTYYLNDLVFSEVSKNYHNKYYSYGEFLRKINYKGENTGEDTYHKILHEIGHSLGLGDEYGDGFINGNIMNMSAKRVKNTDLATKKWTNFNIPF